MQKIIDIEGIGEIAFVKSSRAKRISIVLKPFNGIRVSLPKWVTYLQAIKVVERRKEWIIRNSQKINQIENRKTIFTPESNFKTRNNQLIFEQKNIEKAKVLVKDGYIKVTYPPYKNITDADVQKQINSGIERALRIEAKEYLPFRVKELAKIHGFKYEKVMIRNSKTRWGSCSYKNNISLSLHLMRLPGYLIDFVILHELMHTRIKNHSKEFWVALEVIAGDVKKLRKELKQYRISIY